MLIAQGYITGLKNEDISVKLSADGDSLIVSGVRTPSAGELALMQRQLRREGTETVENMLRLGSGRSVASYCIQCDCFLLLLSSDLLLILCKYIDESIDYITII